ncbi:MAG: hypothetical protein AB7K24_20945 [Gemmataceae bacterium]
MPPWPTVRDLLAQAGQPVQVRMIDGELAFPDEEPPETWRELRLARDGHMVTLRKQADGLAFVVWGNADAAMLQARDLLMWAFAKTGDGLIETDAGSFHADDFPAAPKR